MDMYTGYPGKPRVTHYIPYGQRDGNRLDPGVPVQGLSSVAAYELIPPIS